jgi:hypothetical protein
VNEQEGPVRDTRADVRRRLFVLLTLCAVAFMAQLDLFIQSRRAPRGDGQAAFRRSRPVHHRVHPNLR